MTTYQNDMGTVSCESRRLVNTKGNTEQSNLPRVQTGDRTDRSTIGKFRKIGPAKAENDCFMLPPLHLFQTPDAAWVSTLPTNRRASIRLARANSEYSCGAFGQAAMAVLAMTEQAFDDLETRLQLGVHAGLVCSKFLVDG